VAVPGLQATHESLTVVSRPIRADRHALARPNGASREASGHGTVLVADSMRAFGDAVAVLLSDAGLAATSCGLAEVALVAADVRPAVLLVDGDAPASEAQACAQEVRRHNATVRIAVIADCAESGEAAKEATGAVGIISRHANGRTAAEAVRSVLHGQPLPPASSSWTPRTNGHRSTTDGPALTVLTPRERQVLEAMADGATAAEVAESLGISPNTVRSHMQNLLRKLGVRSRLEAVALLLRAEPRQQGNGRRP
jgi:DNA-binding NarL/FixJ family response regulator